MAGSTSGEKCGAHARRTGNPCKQGAGARTDHSGQGKCWLHGGRNPIKHGRYSKIKRADLRNRIEESQNDPDLLNLKSEVALLRCLTEDLLVRWDDIYGPEGALMVWWMNGREKEPPLPNLPDFTDIGSMVEKIARVVDIIQKHQQAKSITIATLNRVMEQMGVEVAAAVQEAKLDPSQGTAILGIIERRWGSIKLDAYSTSAPRTQA